MAASGNNIAIYFKNTASPTPTDQGIETGVVTHDKDAHGKVTTVMHNFYYLPTYEGGDTGHEVCVKSAR